MEHLEYKIEISAPAKMVWETMLQDKTYRQWVATSWPGSFYEGKWEQGSQIRFIGPDGSGTLAELVEVKPYQRIFARHVAVLGPGGSEDRTSEIAKGWVGIIEEYTFSEQQDITTVTVSIETHPEWRKMFDEGWPAALEELKKITERQFAGQVAR
jgi:uncharacterized protein YndB with AHSA1/START domain